MLQHKTKKYWLPLAAALLAVPLGVNAQQGPPGAPGAPPVPVGPGPRPTPTPTPLMPPPPPPTPPAPGTTPAPDGLLVPGPGGIIPPLNAMPMPPGLPQGTAHPDIGNPGVQLRYKFQAGQTIYYRIVVDANGTVQMAAGNLPIKTHVEMIQAQTIKSVDANGAATISEKVMDFTTTVNGQPIPLPAQTQQQMEQPSTVVMTPEGQVLSFKVASGAGAMSPMGFDPSQLSQMQALPKSSVVVGDKWRGDFTSAVAGIETHVSYTLNALSTDGNTATVGQKIYVAFKPAKPANGTASPVTLNGLLNGTGTQQFDIAAGQILSQTNNLTLDMTVTPAANPQPMKTHFDMTTSITRQSTPASSDEPPTNQLQ
jgi:hypothetical protein